MSLNVRRHFRFSAFRGPNTAAVVLLLLATLVPVAFEAQKAKKPLLKDELIRLLKSFVPQNQIEELARQYGLSFEMNAEAENQLRGAGASDELIRVLRQISPPPPSLPAPKEEVFSTLLIEASPSGTQVFLDGKPAGPIGLEGRLELARLQPGPHTIRLTLAGFPDYEQRVELVGGQPAKISAGLVATFQVGHAHTIGQCVGAMTIGNGRIRYKSEKGKDPLDASLADVEESGEAAMGQFFIRLKDGKRYFFRANSRDAILEAIQRASGKR